MAINAQPKVSSLAFLSSLTLLTAASLSSAAFVTPDWSRANPSATVQAWDIFSSPAGPNAPSPTTTAAVPGVSNPNGVANTIDTSGASFITSGGNIYSFSAPTHIQSTVPDFNLGSAFYTTVLVQTRSLGSIPDYSSYRLTYNDGVTDITITPVAARILSTGAAGGLGGDAIDYAAAFYIPTSAASFTFNFDASSSSMSLDAVIIDTLTTPASTGFGSVTAVPEPSAALLGAPALALLLRRRK